MSKEVKRFYIMPGSVPVLLSGDPAYTPMTNHLTDIHTVPLVLASDYDALLAERDALAKDAERYRFLMRELGGSVSQVVMGSPVFSNEDVNAAIDAALQGEQP
ncbi:hypothetical protein [Stutzerimonas kunmingensis]|uniref:hypothetical protein n=1 Tax=Stutzerimonas kunmingensis TaxID=1211807 RepID=UPI0028A0C219|nr:hypothetical protein [Stutzerimonas kunmingensis]